MTVNTGSGYDRVENDWYVEPEWIVRSLFAAVEFPRNSVIWDPACGRGTIPTIAVECGYMAFGSDIVNRGYPHHRTIDFLNFGARGTKTIVSNPPFNVLRQFVDRALNIGNHHVAVLAPLTFLEGRNRRPWLISSRLSRVLVSSARVSCPPGHLAPPLGSDIRWPTGGAEAYAWFVWLPGHVGEPTITFLAGPEGKP